VIRVGTAKDAAALLKVSVDHLYEMAQRGEIPQLRRVGPELRFDMDELEAWLRTPAPATEARS
jgi:excisionase family DNA binding protein